MSEVQEQEHTDPLSTVVFHVEVTVTAWPEVGQPAVFAGPYSVVLPAVANGLWVDVPLSRMPAYCIRLGLDDLAPADPGWMSARAMLAGMDGSVLGTSRPVRFYGRPSEAGSHVYFPSTAGTREAYSVCVRVTGGGLP